MFPMFWMSPEDELILPGPKWRWRLPSIRLTDRQMIALPIALGVGSLCIWQLASPTLAPNRLIALLGLGGLILNIIFFHSILFARRR